MKLVIIGAPVRAFSTYSSKEEDTPMGRKNVYTYAFKLCFNLVKV